jgi:hypothetical protein
MSVNGSSQPEWFDGLLGDGDAAMFERRRFKELPSLQERLADFAKKATQEAKALPAGPERDMLLRKAKKVQAAKEKEMDAWANSPELQPPK